MPKHILPAVKHTLAFLRIQVKDKVSGVVGVALLISERKRKKIKKGTQSEMKFMKFTAEI